MAQRRDELSITGFCQYCGVELHKAKKNDARFCSDAHRAKWHREHDPRGKIRGFRKLASGGISISVHFHGSEMPNAADFKPGDMVVIGQL